VKARSSREYAVRLEYVVEAHEKAFKQYEKSLRARDYPLGERDAPRHLGMAAQVICHTLSRVLEEPFFYKGLSEFKGGFADYRGEIRKLFSDLGEFLELESTILKKAGLSPETALRLVADVSRSMRMVEGLPDLDHIYNLRERLSSCAKEICDAEKHLLEPVQKEKPRAYFRELRPVGIGLGVIGGITVIGANAVAAPSMPIFLGSAGGGLASIGSALSALT
jgi:hypothetical protein